MVVITFVLFLTSAALSGALFIIIAKKQKEKCDLQEQIKRWRPAINVIFKKLTEQAHGNLEQIATLNLFEELVSMIGFPQTPEMEKFYLQRLYAFNKKYGKYAERTQKER